MTTPAVVDIGEILEDARAAAWEELARLGKPIKIVLEPGEAAPPLLERIAELERNFRTEREKGH